MVSDKRGCKKALTLLLVVGKIGPWSTSTQALVTFHPRSSYLTHSWGIRQTKMKFDKRKNGRCFGILFLALSVCLVMAWASGDLKEGGQAIFAPSQIVSCSSEILWKRVWENSRATRLVTDWWQRWWSRGRTQWMWGSNLADGPAHPQQGMSIAILEYNYYSPFFLAILWVFSIAAHLFKE